MRYSLGYQTTNDNSFTIQRFIVNYIMLYLNKEQVRLDKANDKLNITKNE